MGFVVGSHDAYVCVKKTLMLCDMAEDLYRWLDLFRDWAASKGTPTPSEADFELEKSIERLCQLTIRLLEDRKEERIPLLWSPWSAGNHRENLPWRKTVHELPDRIYGLTSKWDTSWDRVQSVGCYIQAGWRPTGR